MTAFFELPLTRGFTALVSAEDRELVEGRKWQAFTTHPGKTYAIRHDYVGDGRYRTVYLHRLILGAAKGEIADHINGNSLDNRRENLRLADASLNCVNKRHYKPASGFRGVYATPYGRWRAVLWFRRKQYSGGTHERPEDAAAAYDRLAIEHFGDFAVLNFPEQKRA